MAKVVVTREIPGAALEELKREHEVWVYPGPGKIPRQVLLKQVHGCGAILSLITEKVDREVLEAAGSALKIVANYGVGFDNVDVEEATRRGVMVSNTPSNLGDAVAEFTVALVMALSRRMVAADDFMRAGKYQAWDPNLFLGLDLTGKTLGVVGAGMIGSVVAKRLQAVFEMSVVYHCRRRHMDFEADTKGEWVSLPQLLRRADVVSLHVPLTSQTRHLIDRGELVLMKPTAILINTSRGPVVEEKALREALEEGWIWGAALDVFEEEVAEERKHLEAEDWRVLRQLPNVILTPHIGSATIEARNEMTAIAVRNVLQALRGERPESLVDAKVGRGGD